MLACTPIDTNAVNLPAVSAAGADAPRHAEVAAQADRRLGEEQRSACLQLRSATTGPDSTSAKVTLSAESCRTT